MWLQHSLSFPCGDLSVPAKSSHWSHMGRRASLGVCLPRGRGGELEETQRHEKRTGLEEKLGYYTENDSYSHTSFLKQECSFQQNSNMTL